MGRARSRTSPKWSVWRVRSSPCKTCSCSRSRARTLTAGSRADTARPAWPARAPGTAQRFSARPRAWHKPWPPRKCTIRAAILWVTLVDSNDLLLVGLLLLAAVSLGTVVYLLVNPYFSGERRTDKRLQVVTE